MLTQIEKFRVGIMVKFIQCKISPEKLTPGKFPPPWKILTLENLLTLKRNVDKVPNSKYYT